MENISFGLWVTLAGMGTVIIILVALMFVLRLIGWWDQSSQRKAATAAVSAPEEPATEIEAVPAVSLTSSAAGSLSDDDIAAITVAVLMHARLRRFQAAPAMRAYQPGSRLFASRWVASGRAFQHLPWTRGN
jgi:sodium pump decarboxylase gamma subunit